MSNQESAERVALLPCPFCGSDPKRGYMGGEDGGYFYVECPKCTGGGLMVNRFIGVHGETTLDCAESWNERASHSVPAAPTAEQLKELVLEYGGACFGFGASAAGDDTRKAGALADTARDSLYAAIDAALAAGQPSDAPSAEPVLFHQTDAAIPAVLRPSSETER